MDKVILSKKIVEYLDKNHLDVNRFFSKESLADWTICDNYFHMRENIKKFKDWMIEEFGINEFFIPVIHIHTKIDEIVEYIKFASKK